METEFEILEALPIGAGNIWKVVFGLKASKTLDGYDVADGVRITVRVTHEDDEPVSKLLETAYSHARSTLASAAVFLAENTAQSLLDERRSTFEAERDGTA